MMTQSFPGKHPCILHRRHVRKALTVNLDYDFPLGWKCLRKKAQLENCLAVTVAGEWNPAATCCKGSVQCSIFKGHPMIMVRLRQGILNFQRPLLKMTFLNRSKNKSIFKNKSALNIELVGKILTGLKLYSFVQDMTGIEPGVYKPTAEECGLYTHQTRMCGFMVGSKPAPENRNPIRKGSKTSSQPLFRNAYSTGTKEKQHYPLTIKANTEQGLLLFFFPNR